MFSAHVENFDSVKWVEKTDILRFHFPSLKKKLKIKKVKIVWKNQELMKGCNKLSN